MNTSAYRPAIWSTTTDASNGLLLRITRDETHAWLITDLVGLRYGYATDLRSAVEQWAEQVEEILGLATPELGDPLRTEVAAYRTALKLGTSETTGTA